MARESGTGPEHLPRLRLAELLAEVQVRIDAIRGTQHRVDELLEAVLAVGRGLDLPQVLRHIVETAVSLVDAEYGALGVIGDDQQLSQFLTVGVSAEQTEAIGHLPSGHGILGELIRHPRPLRLAELSAHPASYGFPPHHPPMHSFLGVPIRVRNEVFGNLYLTEKRGGQEFDHEDETVLATLAVAAGVAIENARLYAESQYRQSWLEANKDVTALLLSGEEELDVLRFVVERARRILRADLGVIAVPLTDTDELLVALAEGVGAETYRKMRLPRTGSFVGTAMTRAEPVTSTHLAKDPQVTAGPARWSEFGPAVAVPIGTKDGVRGVLLLARTAAGTAFTATETAPLLAFAGQAALAMELAERRRETEQIALLEDRDRIARDLHDLAIQRLFATGMTLQSALRFVEHPEAEERLLRAVDNLDETIKVIRSTIFGLRAKETGPAARGLRTHMVKTVQEAVAALGFTPLLRMEGLVDTDVPPALADNVVAVLQEALSNVAQHARARSAVVSLVVEADLLTLTVRDDGIGIPDTGGRRSGLRNLEERAAALDGTLTLDSPDGGGTRLVWQAPLQP
ncbi:GAF domain-containing protein [Streptomyces sp. NPDC059037]|uniref:GAF domain-containing sensor histidine kinase n=1 Tax=Streptomyces sp. NPDC059037 TaxID=3346710 RepID=UPI0036BFD196